MKAKTFLIASLSLFIIGSGCSCKWWRTPPSEITSDIYDQSETEITPTTEEEVPEYIVLHFLTNSDKYGNTNGNTRNGSLAVYHFGFKVHIFTVGDDIWEWDPVYKEVTHLLDGYPFINNLTVYKDVLFFTATSNQYLYKIDLRTKEVELVIEKPIEQVSRQGAYLYVRLEDPERGPGEWLVVYTVEDMAEVKAVQDIENVNFYGPSNVYTNNNEPLNVKHSAPNFTDIVDLAVFSPTQFISIKYVHLARIFQSQDYIWYKRFLVAFQTQATTEYYFYDEQTEELTFIIGGTTFKSINSDNRHLYFVEEFSVRVYDFEDKRMIETITFNMSVYNLHINNHYMYFLSGNDNLYRYHKSYDAPVLAI